MIDLIYQFQINFVKCQKEEIHDQVFKVSCQICKQSFNVILVENPSPKTSDCFLKLSNLEDSLDPVIALTMSGPFEFDLGAIIVPDPFQQERLNPAS